MRSDAGSSGGGDEVCWEGVSSGTRWQLRGWDGGCGGGDTVHQGQFEETASRGGWCDKGLWEGCVGRTRWQLTQKKMLGRGMPAGPGGSCEAGTWLCRGRHSAVRSAT